MHGDPSYVETRNSCLCMISMNLSSWPKSFAIAVQVCGIPKSKYATFHMYTIVLCLTCSMTELLIFMNLFGINDAV